MAREEIIKKVKTKMCKDCGVYLGGGKCSDNCSITKIIRVLEQEPCEDAISRKEVHRQINKWVASGESENDLGSLHNRIRALPPVTPQQKVGRWINGDDKCPCCGKSKFEGLDADIWADWQPKFCPNCGARMGKWG